MPTDIMHVGLGSEVASLRALGEVRRRQSLVDRLLRERRETSAVSERLRIRRAGFKAPLAPVPGNEP
ncbi:hypothetical protein [Reyranella sp.]|uniref:hypothetical protein n=1 Tax=Reyranella sp. TaxID=1929291 RepID=UPI003C7EB79E